MVEANTHLQSMWREVQSEFGGEEYEVVASEHSHVLVVKDAPRPYVVKVPKEGVPFAFDQLVTEVTVQGMLMQASEEPPVKIPQVLGYGDRPPYLALEYIPGIPLLDYQLQEVACLAVEEQQYIGASLGAFIAWMEASISPNLYDQILGYARPRPFEAEIGKALAGANIVEKLGCGALRRASMELSVLRSEYAEEINRRPIVGHGDLHVENILMSTISPQINGIIDLGYTRRSQAEFEVRNFLAIGPEALRSALLSYQEKSDTAITWEAVRYWSLERWTVMCVSNILKGQPIPVQGSSLMEMLYPHEDWREIQAWNSRFEETD